MISSFFIAATLSASGAPAKILSLDTIQAVEGEIRLGQILDLQTYNVNVRERLSKTIIAKIPESKKPLRISRRSLARWVSAAVPELKFTALSDQEILVEYRAQKKKQNISKASAGRCYVSSDAIGAGEIISIKNSRVADCQDRPRQQVAYFDRKARLVRAATDLSADTYLDRLFLPKKKVADRGVELAFVTHDGPVRVVRRVSALQPAQSGASFFVMSSDGVVFKTVYQPGETE